MRKDSFERFYFEKIALAEGCGCAEHVTRMRDIDAAARDRNRGAIRVGRPALLSRLIAFFARKPAQRLRRRLFARP